MKQILQSLANGKTRLDDLPCPVVRPGHVLIRTQASVISAGTERMLLEFGKSGWIARAKKHPDKVRQVIDKIKTDGLGPTLAAVRTKLDREIPLGYSNAGIVLEIGEGVSEFSVGQRVTSNGHHAEVVCVPRNMVVATPQSVSDEHAAFASLGAISLQGIRLAKPELGETFAVFGLGLLGQIAVQLLRANGCQVIGIDLNSERCALARSFGAEAVDLSQGEDAIARGLALTQGRGVDGAILTVATNSNEPVHQAAQMCRARGRIVLVGVTGLQLDRDDFYKKELSFQVSCSYGPGRYDRNYEEEGVDYPIGHVRFSAQRNFESVLGAMAAGTLDVSPLVSGRIPFDDAESAYDKLDDPATLGLVLTYPTEATRPTALLTERSIATASTPTSGGPRLALIGAGSFGSSVLVPAMKEAGAILEMVVSQSGVGAAQSARKDGFAKVASEPHVAFSDSQVDAVVIATRHDSHAHLAVEALRAGKHVFVEKPLALTLSDLDEIEEAQRGSGRILAVGFNRRFASQVVKAKSLLDSMAEPKAIVFTANAGMIPKEHWTQDQKVGGGRIIGEACHFIDLLIHLAGSPVESWSAAAMRSKADAGIPPDKATITLAFENGSIGTVHYLANGHRSFPKERLEV
ncbi:MAG TPA: bi-domain-containing oxidoreductase, partial [Fimbriimonadaceae bacterium]|nr:bi-domain-containing oxidoreductase [Fimbriimonadaceae bacterium]